MSLNVEYVRELLSKKGWSVRKLAIKSGLSNATTCRIMNNKRGVGGKAIAGIMKAFPEEPMDKLFRL
jgi:lambda repressor-like predicted transcriptional regulator